MKGVGRREGKMGRKREGKEDGKRRREGGGKEGIEEIREGRGKSGRKREGRKECSLTVFFYFYFSQRT